MSSTYEWTVTKQKQKRKTRRKRREKEERGGGEGGGREGIHNHYTYEQKEALQSFLPFAAWLYGEVGHSPTAIYRRSEDIRVDGARSI